MIDFARNKTGKKVLDMELHSVLLARSDMRV